MPSGVSAQCK